MNTVIPQELHLDAFLMIANLFVGLAGLLLGKAAGFIPLAMAFILYFYLVNKIRQLEV
jgi:hypothetical protein